MNRTIKFRGKRLDNGEWAYGSLDLTVNSAAISWDRTDNDSDTALWFANVAPTTVGQFTGLLDKNGKEIYEGDIVIDNLGNKYEVCWYDDLACFMAEMICNGRPYLFYDIEPNKCEVIGNIHTNPELLNEK